MLTASEELQFERAARLRDRITSVHKAAETQQMVSERAEDFDVVGLAEDPLEASVQIFRVRRGRVVGHRGFVAEKVEDLSGPEFMSLVVAQVYGAEGAEVPRRVLVPELPADPDVLESWLRGVREGPVEIAVPQRGAEARAARDRHPLRGRGPGASPIAASLRPQRALQGADRAAGRTGVARGAFADRVLRHEPPAGHRLRRIHGRASRTGYPNGPTTAASRSSPCRAMTTMQQWKRCSRAASPR